MKKLLLLGCGFLAVLSPARALILYGLDNNANTTYASLVAAGGEDIPWQNVARIGGPDSTSPIGTGIYLGNGYILTANHVNPQDGPRIEVDGQVYDYDPNFTPLQVATGVDLKVFKITNGPNNLPTIPLYSGNSEVGPQASVMIGWGQGKGTEIVGQGRNWDGDITNAKRWGTNQVQSAPSVSGGGYNYQALATWFDSIGNPNEFSATLRESGSPFPQIRPLCPRNSQNPWHTQKNAKFLINEWEKFHERA